MSSIIKVNTYQDANGNALFSSDGSGNVTLTNFPDNTPSFLAKASSAQSISISTATTIAFGTEEYDTDNSFASNTFTAPIAGKYYIFASVYWNLGNTQSSDQSNIWIAVNGTEVQRTRHATNPAGTSSGEAQQISGIFNLSANDTVTVVGYVSTGGASIATLADETRFGAYRIIGA